MSSPVPRWVAPVFAVLGAATIPWTAYLAATLPPQARDHNYRTAWVGFDVMLVIVLLGTAFAAAVGHRFVGMVATATATMLVVDAWFDILTSRNSEVPMAVASAVFVELPLAAVCIWIALHAGLVMTQRVLPKDVLPRNVLPKHAIRKIVDKQKLKRNQPH